MGLGDFSGRVERVFKAFGASCRPRGAIADVHQAIWDHPGPSRSSHEAIARSFWAALGPAWGLTDEAGAISDAEATRALPVHAPKQG